MTFRCATPVTGKILRHYQCTDNRLHRSGATQRRVCLHCGERMFVGEPGDTMSVLRIPFTTTLLLEEEPW